MTYIITRHHAPPSPLDIASHEAQVREKYGWEYPVCLGCITHAHPVMVKDEAGVETHNGDHVYEVTTEWVEGTKPEPIKIPDPLPPEGDAS